MQDNEFFNYDGSAPGVVYSIVFAEAQGVAMGQNFTASGNTLTNSTASNFLEAYRWKNVDFNKNTVNSVRGRLIVWSTDNDPVSSVKINDNNISLSEHTGIGVYYLDGNITVTNNTINGADNCLSSSGVTEFSASNNTFINCSNRALYYSDNDGYLQPISATVNNNSFSDSPVGIENVADEEVVQACGNNFTNVSNQYFENPGPIETCFADQCEIDKQTWADRVVNYEPGKQKNNQPIATDRSISSNLLYQADNQFTSLGFGGTVTAEFTSPVKNKVGNDIKIYEVTYGNRNSYPLETALVEVSVDGNVWHQLGTASSQSNVPAAGQTAFDLDSVGLPWVRYIRLTDTSNPDLHSGSADGFDLDAIDASYATCSEPPALTCGDGLVTGTEQCDYAAASQAKGYTCTNTCQQVPFYSGDTSCPENTTAKLVEENVAINGNDADGVTLNLTAGKTYLFEASGTYLFGAGNRQADAGYASENSWSSLSNVLGLSSTNGRVGLTSLISNLGQNLGMGVVNWGSYASDHVYRQVQTLEQNDVTFLISDWYDSWYQNTSGCNNQSCLSDNSGALELDVYECVPTSSVTVCKYDNQENPLAGWSMNLSQAHDEFTADIPVNKANGPTGVDFTLDPAKSYQVKVEGTWTNKNGSQLHDALYASTNNWSSNYRIIAGGNTDERQGKVILNNNLVEWGSYASDHAYTTTLTGESSLNVKLFDAPADDLNNTSWYGDNGVPANDHIRVTITELGYFNTSQTTGEDGCTTFENVEYGSYLTSELMQTGWEQVSQPGRDGWVEVDEPTESFNFVNRELPQLGSIAGYKYDQQELGLSDWTIELYQDGELVTDLQTGEDGSYQFTDLPAGTYNVCEVQQTSWGQLAPVSGSASPREDQSTICFTVSLQAGETETGYDFMNQPLQEEPSPTPSPSPSPSPTPNPSPVPSPLPTSSPTLQSTSTGGDGGGDGGGTGGSPAPYQCNAVEPGLVSGLTIAGTGANSISLSWNAAANATAYNIIFTDTVSGAVYGATDLGGTNYTVNNLTPNRTYTFQVFAENDCQPGAAANISGATALGGPVTGGPTGPGGEEIGEVQGVTTDEELKQQLEQEQANQNGSVQGASTDTCQNFAWWWFAWLLYALLMVSSLVIFFDHTGLRLTGSAIITLIGSYLLYRWLCEPWLWIALMIILSIVIETGKQFFFTSNAWSEVKTPKTAKSRSSSKK